MKHTTFTWDIIRDGVDRETGSPITELIDSVMDSDISQYLYPATMRTNLRVGRTKNFSRADGELTIEYKIKSDRVIFNYYSSDVCEPWTMECKGKEIIPTFLRIITKRLRWINNES